jgi:hypothetical protein
VNPKKKKTAVGAAMLSLTSMALAVGLPAGTSGAKNLGPGGIPVNASDYSLSCGAVSAKLSFNPVLKQPGPVGSPGAVTMKLKATNCTASPPPSGGPPVSISKVSARGTFTIPDASCPGFLGGGALSGVVMLNYKQPGPGGKLASPTTAEVVLGSYSVAVNGGVLVFKNPGPVGLPAVQSTGAFMGTDGGTSSTLSITDGTFSPLQCAGRYGLKNLKFTSGTLFLG